MNPNEEPPRVLVADDQMDILKALRLLLKGEGFEAKTVTTPEDCLNYIKAQSFDVVFIDLNYARDTTSGREGVDLIKSIKEIDENLPIVVMTAWASVDLAVECMREGACDFIQKPWDDARVIATVNTQTRLSRALARKDVLEAENRILKERSSVELVAESQAMRPIMDIIERIGPSDANVLVTGENGTGKGLIARVLHQKSSRRDGPFVSINMGGIAAGVSESELFGHVKGAFTDAKSDRAGRFEMADGGTLFMDEIGNIPMEQQNKLLRVLETGEFERVGSSRTRRVNVRIISATNADLSKEVAEGRFREDLLYRLNTIPIHLPPLRERQEDLPVLAKVFLKQHNKRYQKELSGFAKAALEVMAGYPWPGNIRELDHTVERAVLLSRGNTIQPADLALNTPGASTVAAAAAEREDNLSALDEMSLDEVEKYLIQRTLKRNNGNATKTANDLGLSRSAFYRRLQKFGL